MKSSFLFSLLTVVLFTVNIKIKAQGTMRIMTAAEQNRINTVFNWLKKAVPSSYSNYTITRKDSSGLDGYQRDQEGRVYNTADSKNRLTSYNYVYQIHFSNDTEEYETVFGQAVKELTEELQKGAAADKTRLAHVWAHAAKIEAGRTLTVEVVGNRFVSTKENYAANTPPQPISIGVPTSHARFYLHPESNAIYDPDTHQLKDGADYTDVAVIVLGRKPSTSTTEVLEGTGLKEDEISYHDVTPLKDEATGYNTMPVDLQNIYVRIAGTKSDVERMIQLINWNELNSHLGK